MTAPAPAALPLLRRRDDQVVRGVCAAFARTTGTDPVLWRVVLGVLVVFGGSGLVLYLAGWLLIPEEGQPGSIAERWVRRRDLSRTAVLAAVVVVVAAFEIVTGGDHAAVPLLGVALLAFVVLRHPAEGALRASTTPYAGSTPYTGSTPYGTGTATEGGSASAGSSLLGTPLAGESPPRWWSAPAGPPPVWTPPAPRERRPRSALGLLTTSAALLVVAVLGGLGALGTWDLTLGRLLAAALLVVGGGLLVGSRWGRSRGLIALGLLLGLLLGVAASARTPIALSTGERTWRVTGAVEHRLGAGDAVLDLRDLPSTTPGDVRVDVGAGRLRVLLPADLHVEVTAHVAGGDLLLPDDPYSRDGTLLRAVRTYGPTDAPLVHLYARLGAGRLEVLRDAS